LREFERVRLRDVPAVDVRDRPVDDERAENPSRPALSRPVLRVKGQVEGSVTTVSRR